jgi:hypothetical protein
VIGRHVERAPCIAPVDLHVDGHDIMIRAGEPCGTSERVRLETAEGVTVQFKAEFRVLGRREGEFSAWELDSDPALTMRIDTGSTAQTTVAQLVNRIEDVATARSGYLTLNDMATIRSTPH